MAVYTIHFIRHGITDGNLEGAYIGSTDLPLCEVGCAKLFEYRDKYIYPHSPVIFSSPLKRCLETVEILYGTEPAIIEDLRECDFGDFEQKTAKDLIDDERFNEWIKGGMMSAPPNGESGQAFADRISKAFSKIVEAMMRTQIESAVICTHGGVIMALLAMFGYPKLEMKEWMSENGCGFTVRTDVKSWMRANLLEVTGRVPAEKFISDKEEK